MPSLWSAELDALRPEAREVAERMKAFFAANRSPLSDPLERAHAMREAYQQNEVESPDGIDTERAGVPCRVFEPDGPPRGTYVHVHGGGFFLGSPRMNDRSNAMLCRTHDIRVVSVDYRLAPEHPFPAGPDDCLAVLLDVLDAEAGSPTGPVLVGGESAGATLAVSALLRLRDLGRVGEIAGANLSYGVYDLTRTPSMRGTVPSDVADDVLAALPFDLYVPGRTAEELRTAEYSPLYADLREMPPALFTVGTADELLDDSLFLASRWAAYERETELAVYPDCGHGFTTYDMEMTRRARARTAEFFERCLG